MMISPRENAPARLAFSTMTGSPTFVLVHGAWHGAWSWARLGEALDQRDIPWAALDLPSSQTFDPLVDMMADVNALHGFARGRGPVVLVGHSYGGAVVAEAAPRTPELVGIVHVASLLPRLGQSASDVTKETRRQGLSSPLDAAIRREDGLLMLDRALAAPALYGDCDETTRQWAIGRVATQTLASFRTPRTSPDTSVPTTYVVCQRDQAIRPELQREIAHDCDHVVELASDHCPFLSHPQELADLLGAMDFPTA